MNIFVDAGFYQGVALQQYIDADIVDDTWRIYAFEPSPQIDIDAMIAKFPMKIIGSRKACWTKNGKVGFWLSGHDNASHIDKTSGHAENDKISVSCIDFSSFIANLPTDAYIICNMDIEGAEFDVLEKMLRMHTIDRIAELDIEFHHRMMANREKEDAERLISEIESRGVQLRNKIDL
jgi:FkbM family methyltransferase